MLSRPAVFVLFYVSGIAGLIYQVLWLRRLSLVFGVTVYAASTVLAAFMAGLAIGSALSSRVLRRGLSPLAAFGIAEILVGVTGLLSPFLLDAASSLYSALHRTAPDSLTMLTAARLISSFAILAVPTAMMGTTLPLLSAAVSVWRANGAGISLLYAINTLGAMTGTLLSGLALIPAIGIQRSFLLAASLNVIVGAIALWMARGVGPAIADRSAKAGRYKDDPEAAANPIEGVATNSREAAFGPPDSLQIWPLWIVVVVSGFASLGLEIVWFRLMLQFVIATTEAFTAMLATVLGGIAIGGLIAAWILRSPRDHYASLGIVQALTGVAAAASMTFLLWTVEQEWKTMGLWPAVLLAILPPSICMGIGFPLALGIAGANRGSVPRPPSDRADEVARRIGTLYSLNVAGAIAGSLLAGFVLLPRIGSVNALILLAALFVVSGLWLSLRRRRWIAAAAMAAAFAWLAQDFPDPFRIAIDRRYGDQLREFWRHEGAQTAVSVRASEFQRVLYLDGLHQANDQPDMVRLHRAIGHLPMVLHGNPKEVLVVGMGGGATPGAVSQYPGAQIEVVELADGVRQAAQFFRHVNYDLLSQPNVHVRVDDGRNFLALTDRRFDVITADIIQPGHAGAGHVYSREYFSLVRNALNDDGVVLQWIGHRPHVEYALIMRTFLDVFPDATLWYDANFMVGTKRPLRLDRQALDRLREAPQTREALDAAGLTGFDVLRSWYTGSADEMRAWVGDGPILTDDRPLVEYHHWLPRPEDQPPLDLSLLKGDVARHVH